MTATAVPFYYNYRAHMCIPDVTVSTLVTPITMVRKCYLDDTVVACSDDDVLHGVMQDGEDF